MSFSDWRQRLGKFRFSIVVIVLVGLCVWAGYEIGNARLTFLERDREYQTGRIERLQQAIEQMEYQNNILRVERDVDRVAIERLQQDLRQSHEEMAQVRRELAFYQRVMAPELDADGVIIDSLVITPAGPELYHFQLVLVQVERSQQQLIQGTYRLLLRGRRDGAAVEYNVLQLAGLSEDHGEFAMNYFTRTDGSFLLPDDFIPEMIQVQVRTRPGRETQRQYVWKELVGAVDPLPVVDDNDSQ